MKVRFHDGTVKCVRFDVNMQDFEVVEVPFTYNVLELQRIEGNEFVYFMELNVGKALEPPYLYTFFTTSSGCYTVLENAYEHPITTALRLISDDVDESAPADEQLGLCGAVVIVKHKNGGPYEFVSIDDVKEVVPIVCDLQLVESA